MSELEFKPSDFEYFEHYSSRMQASEQANARLAEMLKDATVVYGYIGTVSSTWTTTAPGTFVQENLTHKGIIINIEELAKQPCKHEPNPHSFANRVSCFYCGVELIASNWREK